ncbi:MAG: hypothetical protein JSW18_02900 [Candidatus Omnitrophota bacterium]|nr:MAG: hypothetical protein JSW17_01310 [Candidatus Omnitrophota bacterium]UCH12901.1 MAG: hypothetical protein JSW18_02900 [Candidatus Omnitrophota bacterium]
MADIILNVTAVKIVAVITILSGFYFVLRKLVKWLLVKRILSASIILSDHRYFEKQKKDIQIFLFGACEFREGIDQKQFKHKAFNFSVPSAGYIEQYYFLKHYIDEMSSLKVLVLQLGDNSFCQRTSRGMTFPVLFNRFIDYKELLSISGARMHFKLLKQQWIYSTDVGRIHYYGRKVIITNIITAAKRFIGRIRIRLGQIRIFFIQSLKCFIRQRLFSREQVARGEIAAKTKQNLVGKEQAGTEEITVKKRQNLLDKEHTGIGGIAGKGGKRVCANAEDGLNGVKTHFSRPVFDRRALIYLEKILNLCKSRNISVVAVCMPRSKYFLKFSAEYVTEDKLLETIVRNPKYENLIFKHLSYLKSYRDKDDFFKPSGVELNREGRQAFSVWLAEDISSIIEEIEAQRK